jgi:hypothetical protein
MADSSTVISQTSIPDYAKPYVDDLLAKTQALTNKNVNMPLYGGERVADASALQQQSYTGAQGLGTAPQLQTGTDIATQGGLAALGAGQQRFQGSNVTSYMSPYMQNVVDIQNREAGRTADIATTKRNAQAINAGAFGGSRQAIMDAEAGRNLAMLQNDNQQRGLQAAYDSAGTMFNNDMNRSIQGAQAATGASAALGQLGTQENQQKRANLGVQNEFGRQQQQTDQNVLTQNYQDFLDQQNQPYKQLSYMSDVLRGTDSLSKGNATVLTQAAQPSTSSQLLGGALGLGSLAKSGLFGSKDGGLVPGYAGGGSVGRGGGLDDETIRQGLIEGAAEMVQKGQARTSAEALQMLAQRFPQYAPQIQALMALATAQPQQAPQQERGLPALSQGPEMANGGIVAFNDGGSAVDRIPRDTFDGDPTVRIPRDYFEGEYNPVEDVPEWRRQVSNTLMAIPGAAKAAASIRGPAAALGLLSANANTTKRAANTDNAEYDVYDPATGVKLYGADTHVMSPAAPAPQRQQPSTQPGTMGAYRSRAPAPVPTPANSRPISAPRAQAGLPALAAAQQAQTEPQGPPEPTLESKARAYGQSLTDALARQKAEDAEFLKSRPADEDYAERRRLLEAGDKNAKGLAQAGVLAEMAMALANSGGKSFGAAVVGSLGIGGKAATTAAKELNTLEKERQKGLAELAEMQRGNNRTSWKEAEALRRAQNDKEANVLTKIGEVALGAAGTDAQIKARGTENAADRALRASEGAKDRATQKEIANTRASQYNALLNEGKLDVTAARIGLADAREELKEFDKNTRKSGKARENPQGPEAQERAAIVERKQMYDAVVAKHSGATPPPAAAKTPSGAGWSARILP